MKVSVVISTYSIKRSREVLECIKSLKKQSLPPGEIILVLDPDKALIDRYASLSLSGVRIIISEAKGLSNARNTGVKEASGDIIAFIDDDAIADVFWLENLTKAYNDPQVFGAGGLIRPIWEYKCPPWFPEELLWVVGCSYKGLPENRSYTRNPIGCNMSFRKDAFNKVGYFEDDIGRFGEKLVGSEEAEFSLRILNSIPGSKIIYDPSAVVWHKVPKERMNLKYIAKRSFYEGYSKALISAGQNSSKSLYLEVSYLKYLLTVSIPSRLKQLYKPSCVLQMLVLFMSLFFVGMGFLFGRLKAPNNQSPQN